MGRREAGAWHLEVRLPHPHAAMLYAQLLRAQLLSLLHARVLYVSLCSKLQLAIVVPTIWIVGTVQIITNLIDMDFVWGTYYFIHHMHSLCTCPSLGSYVNVNWLSDAGTACARIRRPVTERPSLPGLIEAPSAPRSLQVATWAHGMGFAVSGSSGNAAACLSLEFCAQIGRLLLQLELLMNEQFTGWRVVILGCKERGRFHSFILGASRLCADFLPLCSMSSGHRWLQPIG